MFEDFEKIIDDKLFCPNSKKEKQEFNFNFQQPNNFSKNIFYFETLTDNEFFNRSGITDNFFNFYKKIIKSGVGTIIFGGVYLGISEKELNNIARISLEENIISKFKEVNRFAHSNNCKTFLKLKSCYGRFSELNNSSNSLKIASNFGIDPENKQKLLIRISDNKCNEIVSDFAQKVMLSNIAGFDGVFIDASLSNVIGELSSVQYNKRIFGYFSDVKDLLSKMLKSIQIKNNTIILKLTLFSLFDKNTKNAKQGKFFQNYSKLELFSALKHYVNLGVDGFEFVFGAKEDEYLNIFNTFEGDCIFGNFISDIRNYFTENKIKNKFGDDILILYHDNFIGLQNPIKFINNKTVNLIDITKNLYADCNYIKNLINKKSSLKCIKCSYCDKKSQFNFKNECLINPNLLNFNEPIKTRSNKNVAIVGSGISALICAITLINRGFDVQIFEQNKELNHFGKITTVFGFDNLLLDFYNSIEEKIKKFATSKRLVLNLNQRFSVDNTNLNYFDAIIVATGFNKKFLSITGAVQSHVKNIYDALESEVIFDKKKNIVIYAKSILSLKLALYLANNKNITIIIKNTSWLEKEKSANLFYYFRILYQKHANIYFLSQILKINEDNLDLQIRKNLNHKSINSFFKVIKNDRISKEILNINIDCDLLIYEPDITPNNKLYAEIVKLNYRGEVYLIGNALENCELSEIIKSGYFVGKNL